MSAGLHRWPRNVSHCASLQPPKAFQHNPFVVGRSAWVGEFSWPIHPTKSATESLLRPLRSSPSDMVLESVEAEAIPSKFALIRASFAFSCLSPFPVG